MTRRDYVTLSAAIRRQSSEADARFIAAKNPLQLAASRATRQAMRNLAIELAAQLQRDNPRGFEPGRFLEECGV